ncbi:hypothetical protein BJX96DRAFT_156346 [Aspergillus floccosus]
MCGSRKTPQVPKSLAVFNIYSIGLVGSALSRTQAVQAHPTLEEPSIPNTRLNMRKEYACYIDWTPVSNTEPTSVRGSAY